jgi:MotA/TolQ/ExbB proton channel family
MITNDRRSRRFIGINADMAKRPTARSEESIMNWSRAISRNDLTSAALMREHEAPFWRLPGDFYRALTRDDPITHRYLLLLRFILANAIALALVSAAAGQGWVGAILAADQGGLCRAIVAVFVVGLVWSGQRAVQLSRGLNELERFVRLPGAPAPAYLDDVAGHGADSRAILASNLRLKLASRISPIRHLANSLVLLGLIGTVVGFIIALSGVRPEVAADVHAIGPMVSTLIGGMSIALYTTLVGSLLNVWLMVNVRLLEGGSVKLLTATIDSGERHARP